METWVKELAEWKRQALAQLADFFPIDDCPSSELNVLAEIGEIVSRVCDRESETGLHLQHIVTGALAQEIARSPYADAMQERMRAQFGAGVDPETVNSRWWVREFQKIASAAEFREMTRAALRTAALAAASGR